MKKSRLDYYSHIFSKKTISVVYIVVFAVAISCTSALYIPSARQETSTTSLSELKLGRKLYIQKCGSCHTLFLPEKYTKQEWNHWLDEMEPLVSMNTSEKERIFKYLTKGK